MSTRRGTSACSGLIMLVHREEYIGLHINAQCTSISEEIGLEISTGETSDAQELINTSSVEGVVLEEDVYKSIASLERILEVEHRV